MKMVILGATAPQCDKKPPNPSSTSAIGTMVGQTAKINAKSTMSHHSISTRQYRRKEPTVHKQQYQGLLVAPKLTGAGLSTDSEIGLQSVNLAD